MCQLLDLKNPNLCECRSGPFHRRLCQAPLPALLGLGHECALPGSSGTLVKTTNCGSFPIAQDVTGEPASVLQSAILLGNAHTLCAQRRPTR